MYGHLVCALAFASAAFGCASPAPIAAKPDGSATAPTEGRTFFDVLPTIVAYPIDGAILGQAYDLVLERKLPSACVEGTKGSLGAGDLQAKYSDLQDREQIFESLKASVSASFGSAGMGAGGSVEYARSVSIEKEQRNILANISILRGGEQLQPPVDAPAVRIRSMRTLIPLPTRLTPEAFRSICGDGYVAAIRTGARLNLVFSYAMDSTEIKESLKADAQGSYGAASAKASLERIRNDKNDTKNTEVSVFQIGGDQAELPLNAQKALEKIEKFGAFKTEGQVPLELVVVPYRVLTDFPDDWRTLPLPSAAVRGLAAHYWRLVDLSALYTRATTLPNSYYHVFLEPAETVRAARVLREAARCVAAMADRCAQEGSCTLSQLLEDPSISKSCAATSSERIKNKQVLPEDVEEILKLTVGRPAADRTSDERSKGVTAWWQRGQKVSSGKASLLEAQPAMSPYDAYYAYLARSPWLRVLDGEGKHQPSDLTQLVLAYCQSQSHKSCESIAVDKVAKELTGLELESANALYSAFVLNMRLASMSAAVCERNLTHPMCQLPDDLVVYLTDKYAPLKVGFGPKRNFVLSPPPPPTPAKPPHEPWDPCFGGVPGKNGCPPV